MDVETLIRLAKRQFGDEYEVIINNDDLYGWIYDGETEITRYAGSNVNVINTTVGAFPLAIPDMVNIKRVVINGQSLTPLALEELELIHATVSATGNPTYFYRENRTLKMYPMEAGSGTVVTVYYNKMPVLISGDPVGKTLTVPEIYHNDLLHFVLSRAHNKMQDRASEEVERTIFEKSLGIRKEEAQATNDGPTYKIDDPMDYDQGWT